MESKLFTPVTFGPLTLRNRTIRSAAFESMCPGNTPRRCYWITTARLLREEWG